MNLKEVTEVCRQNRQLNTAFIGVIMAALNTRWFRTEWLIAKSHGDIAKAAEDEQVFLKAEKVFQGIVENFRAKLRITCPALAREITDNLDQWCNPFV